AADAADLLFGQRAALLAVADLLQRLGEHGTQVSAAGAVALQQKQRHALGRVRAHPGQTAEGLDQFVYEGTGEHGATLDGSDFRFRYQKGSLTPSGRLRPAARPARLPLFFSSSFLTTSLMAAAIRSSTTSLSSVSRPSSSSTFTTSWRPFMCTRTRPAPDSPMQTVLAASCWAFCSCSCIWRACFINSLKSVIDSSR